MSVLLYCSASGFSLVQVLVQIMLEQSLLKATTLLEDVRRCYVQFIYVKRENIKIFLTDLLSLLHFMIKALWLGLEGSQFKPH